MHTASSLHSFDNLYGYNGIKEVNDFGLEVNRATFRTLDPALGRWWQVDPEAEQLMGLSPYNSMNLSPLMHSDPQGDSPILIGAAIGFLSNGIGNAINGQNFFKGGLQAVAFGAISGAVSSGIGTAANGLFGQGASLGKAAFQAGVHGLSGGLLSSARGGSFGSGALSGAISSGIGSGIEGLGGNGLAQWLGGGLSGGIGSAIAGGSFWDGVGQGLITGGLNHAAHSLFMGGPPWEYNGKIYDTKQSLYTAILADQAAEQFGLKDIAALGGIALGAPILPTRGKLGGATRGTSIASKYLSKIPGKSPVKLPTLTGVPKLVGGKGMRFTSTKLIGRFIGRSIPIVGWGVLGYDAGVTIYKTTNIYNGIIRN